MTRSSQPEGRRCQLRYVPKAVCSAHFLVSLHVLPVFAGNKGEVSALIIGSGPSTIPRILERAEMLFDETIYGVIGGLHYPVTASRATKFGIPLQSVFCTGKLPWTPISRRDVAENITFLQRRDPQLVSLSPHDSCDWSIEAFRSAFREAYRELRVGETIVA